MRELRQTIRETSGSVKQELNGKKLEVLDIAKTLLD